MQNSKRSLKQILLSATTLVLFVAVLCFVIGKMLTPVSFADFFRRDIKEIEDNNEEVELLILGDSKVYSSMDTRILEEKMGYKNVIVAASSSQPMNGTYFLLKDMVERIHPEKVIISVDYGVLLEENKLQPMLLVTDRLSLKNRLLMFVNCFYGRDLLYYLDIFRYRDNLDNICEIVDERKQMIERGYIDDPSSDDYYQYKGFVYRKGSISTGNMPIYTKGKFDESKIDETNLAYLDKCVELCKENDIELMLIDSPTTMMRMFYVDNYAGASDYYDRYAKEHGIKFYNLNYLKDREVFLPDEMMIDYNHTSGEGAVVVSELFAEILQKIYNGEDVSSYFYQDFDDLSRNVTRVVAVDAEIETTEDNVHFFLRCLHSENVDALYQIEYKDANGNYKTLVEWTTDNEFDIKMPEDSAGEVKVMARSSDSMDNIAYQFYNVMDHMR